MRTLEFVKTIVSLCTTMVPGSNTLPEYDDVLNDVGIEFIPKLDLKIRHLLRLEQKVFYNVFNYQDEWETCEHDSKDCKELCALWDSIIFELDCPFKNGFFPPAIWKGTTDDYNNSDYIPF